MTPDAKQKYEAVYLDQKKLENKPDPIDEYAPYISRIGISEKELANIIALNHGDKSATQRDIVTWFNSQDTHNFGFTYNGNVYLFNNSEYSLISAPTSLTTTDNLVLKGVDNNGAHDITITFNVDGNGNITSMQGNVTTFKQIKAESNKITISKEEWEEAQDGIRGSFTKKNEQSSLFLKDYSFISDSENRLGLKRSLGTGRLKLNAAKRNAERAKDPEEKAKYNKLVEAWEKVISIVESITSLSIPTISLENGDTVTQNGKRYTIIDKENLIGEDEVTKEQVTLTIDNLIKEETQCIPVKFKMI